MANNYEKVCPICGNPIHKSARRCKHCHSILVVKSNETLGDQCPSLGKGK